MRSTRRIRGPVIWLIVADLLALLVFAVALGVALSDGVHSGALIIAVPPIVLAAITSLAFVAADCLPAKVPLIVAMVLCGIGILGAMMSFITPLVASTVPVGGLLIAACATRLGTSDIAPRSY